MSTLEENARKASEYIRRIREKGVLNRIGGKECPAISGEVLKHYRQLISSRWRPLRKVMRETLIRQQKLRKRLNLRGLH